MNKTNDRPREVERYIASRIKRLDDTALVKLLEQLRQLTTTNTQGAAS